MPVLALNGVFHMLGNLQCIFFSIGSDLLERCKEDRCGVWQYDVCAPVPSLFLPPECPGISGTSHTNCDFHLPALQKCHAGSPENQ